MGPLPRWQILVSPVTSKGPQVHVRELVKLGAVLAIHGSKFVQFTQLLTQRHLHHYWLACHCRHDRWFQVLKTFEQASSENRGKQWPAARGVMEEVLASELLARVWAAVGSCFDQQHHSNEFEPILESVLSEQLESKQRVLAILARGRGFTLEEGRQLKQLRRQTERWTDLLLGYLAFDYDVSRFACDPAAARDFSTDLVEEHRLHQGEQAWQVTLASLQAAFHKRLATSSPNGDWNQRIATSILACFRNELWDCLGSLSSSWLPRLNYVTAETQGLLEEIWHVEEGLA